MVNCVFFQFQKMPDNTVILFVVKTSSLPTKPGFNKSQSNAFPYFQGLLET